MRLIQFVINISPKCMSSAAANHRHTQSK